MAQPAPARFQVQFGPFTADLRAYELRKHGIRIKLQDRPFQILTMLLERPGEVVTREELRARLWPDGTFVDFDNNISSSVGKLRAALADSAAAPRYIETMGRHGYRFVGELIAEQAVSVGMELPAPAVEAQPESDESASPPEGAVRRPRFVIGAVLLIGIALLGYFQWSRSRERTQPGKVMLAVLPFANLTGDPAQEYFSDGVTEEMITQLGRLDPQHLGVIARTSVMRYKGSGQPLAEIGRELGVQYVLEGSVRHDAAKVRITAQLIQIKDDTHLWAREYDRHSNDLLNLQAEIAEEVAGEIERTLGGDRKAAAVRPAASLQSPQAYEFYLRGRYFWNKRSPEGFRHAIEYFEEAIAADPGFARAYAGLADSYAMLSIYGLAPAAEYMPKARAAALQALRRDDSLAEAHASLGLIAENYDYDWQTAEKEYRRASTLNPNFATAHHWYAESLAFQGRFEEALAESERALHLDPFSLIIAADNGAILYFAGQYDRAIERFRGVLEMDPSFTRAYIIIGAYIEKGETNQALSAIAAWRQAADGPWTWDWEAFTYGRAGDLSKAERAVTKLRQTSRAWHVDPTPFLAHAYAGMNDKERALLYLGRAYREHSNAVTVLKVDPAFAFLHDDPRFQELLQRVGLAK